MTEENKQERKWVLYVPVVIALLLMIFLLPGIIKSIKPQQQLFINCLKDSYYFWIGLFR